MFSATWKRSARAIVPSVAAILLALPAFGAPRVERPLQGLHGAGPAPVLYNGEDLDTLQRSLLPASLVRIVRRYPDGSNSFCMGVAITWGMILTAGHCLTDARQITVEVPAAYDSTRATTIPARDWRVHPAYNGGRNGRMLAEFNEENAHSYVDLGIVRIDESPEFLLPMPIAPLDHDPALHTGAAYVFGFRRDEFYRLDDHRQAARLKLPRWLGKSSALVVPLERGRGWCVRDSGGPVAVAAENAAGMQTLYLTGIAFAFFDPFRVGDESHLAQIWGSIDKVPGCGKRLGFVHVGRNIEWIRAAMDEMSDKESARLQFGR